MFNYIFNFGHIHLYLLSKAYAGWGEIPKKKDRVNENYIYVCNRVFNFGYFNECNEPPIEY